MSPLNLHPSETRRPRHQVAAAVQCLSAGPAGYRLRLRFEVAGARAVCWPVPSAEAGARCDGLWQHTCFECFVAAAGSTAYGEWNFAHHGAWAAYAFADYREGMQPMPAVQPPAIRFEQTADVAVCEVEWVQPRPLPAAPLALGLTAVVREQGGEAPFYWALHHAGARPDFHVRDSFIYSLECVDDDDTERAVSPGY